MTTNILPNLLITQLRRKDLSREDYRKTAHNLGLCMAHRAAEYLATSPLSVTTPLGTAQGIALKNSLILVPILRSGLVLLPPFIQYFGDAGIGCVGLRRDEVTAIPKLYYQNIPKINPNDYIVMLDPMIATGGSACAALNIITQLGITQERILFVGIIGAQEGVDNVKKSFPGIKLLVGTIDSELNAKKFIVPGLGDFGDRFFGTE